MIQPANKTSTQTGILLFIGLYLFFSPAIVVQRRDSTRCDKQQKPGFHAAQNQERMDQEQQKLQKHIARAVKQMSIGIIFFFTYLSNM